MGIAAHLLLLPWYAASGLVAPGWAVAVLLAVWVALLAMAIHQWKARPYVVAAIPITAVVVWLAVVSAGGAWLGWTA